VGVEVRPGGARELLFAGAAEVGELEEVTQLGGREVFVDGLEGVPREVASARAFLAEEDVSEIEPHGVEPNLPEPVATAEDRESAVDGGSAGGGLGPLRREPPHLKGRDVESAL